MMKSFIHFLLFDCLSFKTLKIKQFQNINQFQTVKSNYEMSIIFCEISLSNTSCFYVWYWWDCVFLWLKAQARIQRFSEFLHFCGLTSSEIYWCVFGKTKRFFPTFFGLSSREFDQKNQFLKNEKKIVKNLQKRPFFCSFVGGKAPVSTPRFLGTPFWALS